MLTRAVLVLCLAARAIGTLHFNRTIAPGDQGHALFVPMGLGFGISMLECAAKAMETWDTNGETQAANAFKYKPSSSSCEYGKVPKGTPVGNPAAADDDEGIYVIDQCMESEFRYEDLFAIMRLIEGEMDKFADKTMEEKSFLPPNKWDNAILEPGCDMGIGEVKFGNLKSHNGMCSGGSHINTHHFTEATLMVWIYTTSAENGDFDTLLYVTSQQSWFSGFHFGLKDGRLHLLIYQGLEEAEHHVESMGPKLEHNKWIHIAVTWQHENGLVKFYVDGETHGEEVTVGPIAIQNPLGSFSSKACVYANPCHITDARAYMKAKNEEDMRKLYEDAKPPADECPMVTHAAPKAGGFKDPMGGGIPYM